MAGVDGGNACRECMQGVHAGSRGHGTPWTLGTPSAGRPAAARGNGKSRKGLATLSHREVAVTTKCRSGRSRRSSATTLSLPTPEDPLMTTTRGRGGGTWDGRGKWVGAGQGW
jgi:hypothetical protein